MRVRVDVTPNVASLRWGDVHGPARGVIYELLGSQDSALARELHDEGWNGQSIKPLGMSSPQFRGAPRRNGVYTTSSDGSVWFGSPVPEIGKVLVSSLEQRQEIRWGAARLRLRGISVEDSPPAADGPVELSTSTPVVLKDDGTQFLLPTDEGYVDRLQQNLSRKAAVLGLPAPRGLQLLDHGPRRRFLVRGAPRNGAQVHVAMEADGRLVEALRSWGLGLDTMQGFGWVR